MKLLIFFFFCLILGVSESASSHSSTTVWKVYDLHHEICIMMEAGISLNLSYLESDALKYASLSVPDAVTVNSHLSSCGVNVSINETSVWSQVLHLDFDPAKYPGWSIEFSFTQNSVFHSSSSKFSLYDVSVTANYSVFPDLFQGFNPNSPLVNYTQPFDFSSLEPSEIADEIYANIHYSYFCESSQEFPINTDESYGFLGWVTLKNLRVQAFAPSGTTKFGDREICPQDQTEDDIVPIIVGAVLAAIVLVTLVIYLVYRARQPPSVLYLTNPQSHFEDLGVMKAQKEEEEDEESGIHVVHHHNRISGNLENSTPRNHVTYDNVAYVD